LKQIFFMKRILLFAFTILLAMQAIQAQDKEPESLGLPGDNLNLYAALKLFQECKTLEEFEKRLNDEEEKINNLDLDNDEKIDYITVTDNVKDDVHSIALEVFMNKDEKQGVAVFVVSREKNGEATIQVIGDEDLYGKDYIIEPQYDDAGTPNPGYAGQEQAAVAQTETQPVRTTYVEVYNWPIVSFIYVSSYRPWVSPWYWGYYPGWWRPWRPQYWHWYYGYHYHWNYWYYRYYRRWSYYRYSNWYNWYYGMGGWRRRSVVYYNQYNQGLYRKTYSRPEKRLEGSASFVKKYPTAPGLARPVPEAKVPGFKPDLVKPVTRPAPEKPVVTKPAPVKPSPTKPTTRPVEDPTGDQMKPVPSKKPSPSRPTTRPIPTKPTKPTRPSTKPTPTKPNTRPVIKPTTRPSTQQPATRPGARTIQP